jgi:hypothetical protein
MVKDMTIKTPSRVIFETFMRYKFYKCHVNLGNS